jgi:hypothetical protein
MTDGAAFAQIFLQRDDSYITFRVLGSELERHSGGTIRGAVVDDDNLVCTLAFERRRREVVDGRSEHDR